MSTKQNAPHHPKAMEGASNDKPHSASILMHVKALALPTDRIGACAGNFSRTQKSCGRIRPKAKAPALENVKSVEVATPTVKRGFVMPKISQGRFSCFGMVCGHGWGYPQGHPHGYGRVFNSHAHPLRLKTYRVVLHPVGAKTMQQVNPLVRPSAPTPKAAPAITTTEAQQAFALLEATSAAALAAFYLRKGNVQAARRKAVQLLKSLQALPAKG